MYNKRIFDITGKTSSQKTSSTWNHFTEPENGMVTCKKCGTEMSSKYLQNLTRHHKHCEKAGEASNVEGGDNQDIGSEATDSDRD
uniref:BED-type domain-containing protein n=1 Tax=Meloidogyne javanica TaxID=6303 RepID=A0A915NA42_MELJA